MNNITIRPATEADLPAMHALVYELAVYEKEPEAVVTTPAEYLEDFRNGLFEGHIAELDGQVAGMTLFFMAYSTWRGKMLYLDDFVVSEKFRRHGIGQLKREELRRYKSPLEIEMMRAIKRTLDPQGLMNPGKVL